MKDILHEIIGHKQEELYGMKQPKPSMRRALLSSTSGIIAEFKRRSPSKGWIKEEGRAEEIPLSYQSNGASGISILTDRDYFGGDDDFIRIARRSGVSIPILYKNFVIDPLQVYSAALCGASTVLLIASCLSKPECSSLIHLSHDLGMEVLLEMHDERDLEYCELDADLYGINNRNLGSFVTDVENSFRLAEKLPCDVVKVSESGISDPHVIKDLRSAGFRGFLIGETFMRSSDPGKSLCEFIRNIN